MRIALTVWDGRIAPLFDVAGTLTLVDEGNGTAGETREVSISRESGVMERLSILQGWDVDLLICGAVSRQVHRMLALSGIEVFPFVSGDAEEVLEAYLSGELETETFRMPGCGRGRGRGSGRGAGFKGRGRNRGSCPRGKEV